MIDGTKRIVHGRGVWRSVVNSYYIDQITLMSDIGFVNTYSISILFQ